MTLIILRSRSCAFLATLLMGCALLVIPAGLPQVTPGPRLYIINASGNPIPTIFREVRPDARFARVLAGEIASSLRRESVPHFQSLVYHGPCPKTLLRNAAFPGSLSCYGEYMEPSTSQCPYSCTFGENEEFYSTGSQPCHGYFFAGDNCGGCTLYEASCSPC